MADKYRVGAGGSWSTSGNWSLTSGGAGGAGAPGASEKAIIDANTPAGTILLNGASASIGSLVWNPTNVVRLDRTANTFSISTALAAGMDFQQPLLLDGAFPSPDVFFLVVGGTASPSFSSVAQLPCTIRFSINSGTATLSTALSTLYDLDIAGTGTVSFNTQNVTARALILRNGSNTTFSTGTTTLTGTGTVLSHVGTTSISAASSTIVISDTSSSTKTFFGDGKTFGEIRHAGNGPLSFSTAGFTASLLSAVGAYTRTIQFTSSQTYTLTGISIEASAANPVTVTASSSAAAIVNAASSSTIFQLAFATISKITTSTGSGQAFRSTNGGTMTGWTFPGDISHLFFGSNL